MSTSSPLSERNNSVIAGLTWDPPNSLSNSASASTILPRYIALKGEKLLLDGCQTIANKYSVVLQ